MTITLKKVRISYAHIWEPKDWDDGREPKYSVSCLISKDDKENLALIEKAEKEAIDVGIEKKRSWKGNKPKKFKHLLNDGDQKDNEEYEGMMYLNASSKHAPLIVDQKRQEILDTNLVYSGCICNVNIYVYPYDTGGKGISAILKAIQKVRDDKAFGPEPTTADVFEDVPDEEFTGEINYE